MTRRISDERLARIECEGMDAQDSPEAFDDWYADLRDERALSARLAEVLRRIVMRSRWTAEEERLSHAAGREALSFYDESRKEEKPS